MTDFVSRLIDHEILSNLDRTSIEFLHTRRKLLKAFVTSVSEGDTFILGLLPHLEPYLTSSTTISYRTSALELLDLVLCHPDVTYKTETVQHFVTFFLNRLADRPSCANAFDALHHIVLKYPVFAWIVLDGLVNHPDDIHIAALNQKTRSKAYKLFLSLYGSPSTPKDRCRDVITRILDLVSNESDPRNLIIVFELYQKFLDSLPDENTKSDDDKDKIESLIFDRISMYFPITITRDETRRDIDRDIRCLSEKLHGMMTQNDKMVIETIGLVLHKLRGGEDDDMMHDDEEEGTRKEDGADMELLYSISDLFLRMLKEKGIPKGREEHFQEIVQLVIKQSLKSAIMIEPSSDLYQFFMEYTRQYKDHFLMFIEQLEHFAKGFSVSVQNYLLYIEACCKGSLFFYRKVWQKYIEKSWKMRDKERYTTVRVVQLLLHVYAFYTEQDISLKFYVNLDNEVTRHQIRDILLSSCQSEWEGLSLVVQGIVDLIRSRLIQDISEKQEYLLALRRLERGLSDLTTCDDDDIRQFLLSICHQHDKTRLAAEICKDPSIFKECREIWFEKNESGNFKHEYLLDILMASKENCRLFASNFGDFLDLYASGESKVFRSICRVLFVDVDHIELQNELLVSAQGKLTSATRYPFYSSILDVVPFESIALSTMWKQLCEDLPDCLEDDAQRLFLQLTIERYPDEVFLVEYLKKRYLDERMEMDARHNSLTIFAVLKGLLCRGGLGELEDKIIVWITSTLESSHNNEETASQIVSGFQLLFGRDDRYLPRDENFLWHHKFYTKISRSLFAMKDDGVVRTCLLLVTKSVSRSILEQDMEECKKLVIAGLNDTALDGHSHALYGVILALEMLQEWNEEGDEDNTFLSGLSDSEISRIISRLCELAVYKNRPRVRSLSISCLGLLKCKEQSKMVLKGLRKCLDDEKKEIRRLAVVVRNSWIALGS